MENKNNQKMTIGGKIMLILIILLVAGYCLFRFTNIFTQSNMTGSQFVGVWDQQSYLRESDPDSLNRRVVLNDDGSAEDILYLYDEGLNGKASSHWTGCWKNVEDNVVYFFDKEHLNGFYLTMIDGNVCHCDYNKDTGELTNINTEWPFYRIEE